MSGNGVEAETLTIERLGAQGDGIATLDGQPVYVPFTLPGETVAVELDGERGDLLDVVTPSPDRIAPACRHYTDCGGCSLQHLGPAAYTAFKQDLVRAAFASRGLNPEISEPIIVPSGSRRRVTLAARRNGHRLLFGFHGRKSHRIVPIDECPVARPAIVKALPALEQLAAVAAPKKGDLAISVLTTANGLDVCLTGLPPKDADKQRLPLIEAAMAAGIARLSVGDEVIVERVPPSLSFVGVSVVPPPGGFLQATAESEQAMTDLILAAVKGAKAVADLFCGAGTFTFPLATKSAVHAVEGDKASMEALDKGARFAKGLKQINRERRDLFRRPLTPKELARFDAVVFDPPRAGANAQAAELAASKVPTVVAVSCNPATLARDVRLLVDGGYGIESVTPVDQFLWSAHVEAVVVLRRASG
ncbi:23S rRNA (uracil(1939)-C(5))-methyltransferase RlmD [Hartmannibacter diazotrophicus]|uniref:23S rRNA (Uracil(1939)-C(5))-methyltransferase RlmD n=1 Tax=Hartmannibacter diazotrophicus TaxID=1482074 RepID=A0A2C9D398_9HYPH|nr:class I SAM-dependent RNA methyltransferase [Hartmannibacter diazotrophicus]SON54746.1 23S rRNA (uracil(1939)-C(5))-methyltransferase RlmD [Hartmannibacter diazotrophicus]